MVSGDEQTSCKFPGETEVVVETENAIVEIPVEEVKEERAAPASKQEWQQIQDPYGRPCW